MKYVVAVCAIAGFIFCLQCVIVEGKSIPHDNTGWGISKDSPLRGFR